MSKHPLQIVTDKTHHMGLLEISQFSKHRLILQNLPIYHFTVVSLLCSQLMNVLLRCIVDYSLCQYAAAIGIVVTLVQLVQLCRSTNSAQQWWHCQYNSVTGSVFLQLVQWLWVCSIRTQISALKLHFTSALIQFAVYWCNW